MCHEGDQHDSHACRVVFSATDGASEEPVLQLMKSRRADASPICVSLKNRRLTDLPDWVVRQSQNLRDLDLRRNWLRGPSLDTLRLFGSLQSLHLAHNGLTEFPAAVCALVTLERLFINDNSIASLPDELGQLVRLRVLRACQNRLTSIPAAIAKCTRLESLILGSIYGGNDITELPLEIGQLRYLRELDVCRNALERLPDTIGDMSELRTLNLCGNRLTSLPHTVGDLANLRELHLASNRLEYLPVEVGNLRNLAILNVRCNRLAHLPGELAWLKASTSLFISENPFCEVADAAAAPDGFDGGVQANSSIMSLRELCAQAVLRSERWPSCEPELPDELAGFLRSARPCTACRQPFFDNCRKKIEFVNLHGHIRVPSVHNLCLPSCARGCAASSKLNPALSW